MKALKNVSLIAILALFAVVSAGCGLGTTAEQSKRTVRRVAEYDARMLVDDIGLFTQTHRPHRGSRWVVD